MRGKSTLTPLLFAIVALVAMCAHAQSANDAVYRYTGVDRDARLVERAKQEGRVVLYTSLAPTESQPLAQAFEAKYAIKVELWRSLSDKVVQRALTETQSKRYAVDVVETNGPEMEMLARERVLAPFHSPYIGDLPPNAIPSHRQWMPDRLQFFVVAFNTAKVKRDELPSSYEGFLDPKWKGRIGIEATDAEWMATITKLWGASRANDYFAKLAAMKPDMRKGHVLLAELVASGEVPVGLTVYNSNAESIKRKGAPIDWVPMDPVVARPQGIGVAANAPHPNAALLFADFVLSPEGQRLFESLGRGPVSRKVASAPTFAFTLIDPVTVLDEAEKWNKEWDRLFLTR